jgi:DNA-binding transcriptional LysR family regulator
MTLEQYLRVPHVSVRPGREHLFEEYLEKEGLKRRVMLETSHFASLLPIIESSNLIATVPRDLADMCVAHARIRIVDVPLKAPVIELHQFWHQRFHKDPANVWLRGLVHELFRA